jgi:hypothetical protein
MSISFKQVLSGDRYQQGGEDIRKGCRRVDVVEMEKIRPVETIPGVEGGEIKENMEGANSTMLYYKIFCKCHNISPSTTIIW